MFSSAFFAHTFVQVFLLLLHGFFIGFCSCFCTCLQHSSLHLLAVATFGKINIHIYKCNIFSIYMILLYFIYSSYFRYNWNALISILSKTVHPIILLVHNYFYVTFYFVTISWCIDRDQNNNRTLPNLSATISVRKFPNFKLCSVILWIKNGVDALKRGAGTPLWTMFIYHEI